MANQNGQLILHALEDLYEPATLTKIVSHIAEITGVSPSEVKDSVKETLEAGIRFGYIQKTHGKYYTAPLDIDTLSDVDVEKVEGSSGELEDKSRRIRRGRVGRRRLGGSRRRRRRRRSSPR